MEEKQIIVLNLDGTLTESRGKLDRGDEKMDLKEMYEERAQEIAEQRYNEDFYDLDEESQYLIYNEAMLQIQEELIDSADSLRKERQGIFLY